MCDEHSNYHTYRTDTVWCWQMVSRTRCYEPRVMCCHTPSALVGCFGGKLWDMRQFYEKNWSQAAAKDHVVLQAPMCSQSGSIPWKYME